MELFKGEKVDMVVGRSAPIQSASTDAINDKYMRGDVRIVTEQARYPLSTIVTMLESGDYNRNPVFQRRPRWNQSKQSRLMESFIMNVPIPPIFLYEVAYSRYEVMDGLQRLNAISEFYLGKFALSGLDQWPELNGMTYKTLPEQVRRGIDRRYLSSIILLQETAQDLKEADRLKQLVFERINSGGVKLEAQESRNALHDGLLNQMCIKLARLDSFCRMWGIPTDSDLAGGSAVQEQLFEIEDDDLEVDRSDPLISNQYYQKMQDVELVLRFFAFRQLADVDQGRLSDFLDLYLQKGNQLDPGVLDQLRNLFISTSNLVYEVLGESAFWTYRNRTNGPWSVFERPTKVLYDSIMYAFSLHLADREVLVQRSSELRGGLALLYQNEQRAFGGRFNEKDIGNRNRLMCEFLDGFLGL